MQEDVDLRTGADFQVQIASPDEATPHDKEPSIEFVLKSGLTEVFLCFLFSHFFVFVFLNIFFPLPYKSLLKECCSNFY